MSERFVGVWSVHKCHAVLVPDDLPDNKTEHVSRPGRGALTLISTWHGVAECGQPVSGIIAGPNHGHDWDRIANAHKCDRCERKVVEYESRHPQ